MTQTETGEVSSGREIKKNITMRRIKQNRLSREVVQSTSLQVSRSDRTKPRATLFDLRADPAVSRGLD